MGYKMMIFAAGRVYLSTGKDGTTLACEVALSQEQALLEFRVEGWQCTKDADTYT